MSAITTPATTLVGITNTVPVSAASLPLPSGAAAAAVTKSRTALYTGTTLVAGATALTSSTVDLTSAFHTVVGIKLTNGATGPTVAAAVQVQTACDAAGTNWVNYGGSLVGATLVAAVSSWAIELPQATGAFRLISGSNTGQDVTLDADYSRVTAI